MFNSLYKAKFSDLDLPKPTRMGFDTIDWEEEIEALMSEMCEYEGSRIYGCLLYTSPSPRDLSTSRMPSSA